MKWEKKKEKPYIYISNSVICYSCNKLLLIIYASTGGCSVDQYNSEFVK